MLILYYDLEHPKKELKMNIQVKNSLLAVVFLQATPAMADDWDNFYRANKGKNYSITWKQKNYFRDGSAGKEQLREFSYAMLSSSQVKRSWRNENLEQNGKLDSASVVISRGSVSMIKGSSNRQYIEIKGNTLINRWITAGGLIYGEFTITPTGNACVATIADYDYPNQKVSRIVRTTLTCKVIKLGK